MTAFTITVQDQQVKAALQALSKKLDRMDGALLTIGEGIIERTKRRFETSTGPDGVPWKPNSAATLGILTERLIGARNKLGARSNAYRLKDGSLNSRGRAIVGNKKPLIGPSQDLRRQIVAVAAGNTLSVISTPKYAAIQQFGGKAGRGRKVTIPARPFLPVKPDGSIYPADQAEILKVLNQYLSGRF